MPKRGFFNFLNLFAICFWNFLARVECEWNSGLNFFSLFLSLSYPVLAKNNAGKEFFNFLFCLYFFRNFLARVDYERNSGLKIMSERGFLIFFFYIFFGIFLPGSSLNGIRVYNFFLRFSAYFISFWLKIMPERVFLIS